MIDTSVCPCEGFTHPQVIFNPPGRSAIAYRVGDYISFRHALLLPLKDANGQLLETELINWDPGAEGDLAVQMVEWWAYLADILTFYSDRIANESYLRSADLPESVQRLIRLLGYRPRPGIGARGVVAALTNTAKPFTLPQGFQIQSKPGPGKQPQIFELDGDTLIQSPDAIAADPVANPALFQENGVLLKGTVSNVKAGDRLLLLKKGWTGSTNESALVTVQKVNPEKDPQGQVNTRVIFPSTPSQLNSAHAEDYRLLKSNQYVQVWQYPTGNTPVIYGGQSYLAPGGRSYIRSRFLPGVIHLASLVRQIRVNDPILLYQSETRFQLIQVTQYTEVVWYANPNPPPDPNPTNIVIDPTKGVVPPGIPIPIPHTQLSFRPTPLDGWDGERGTVLVYYGWQDVGTLIPIPAARFGSTQPEIIPDEGFSLSKDQLPLLLESADGNGIAATVSISSQPPALQLSDLSESSISLKPPLQMLFNLLSVSRGQTVPAEILGSGDASLAGQEFVLQNSPLTYLLSGDSTSGGNYKSTLRIWVDDIEWKEVPSFYGQPADARIFVTREDENHRTHVQFGDGVNGARLPSKVNNILARYRYGSGKDAPDAGALTVIAKPYPNLKAIRNPVPVGGGADPDPPDQIRRYAPQSVLTFGRAVSGDDYEAIASLTPAVARAKVYWTWDGEQQRSLVKLYVGDDDKAREAALIALKGAADPNRPVKVELAIPISVRLSLTVEIAGDRLPEPVLAAVKTALLHPETGLLGTQVIQIGQAIYQSQIYASCLAVLGVVAVHDVQFLTNQSTRFQPDTLYRHDPGEGGFFQLNTDNLILNWEVSG